MGHSFDAMTECYSHVGMEEKRQAHVKVVELVQYREGEGMRWGGYLEFFLTTPVPGA